MKNILVIILVCLFVNVSAQTKTEKINRQFSFEVPRPENALIVANVSGNISVEGYPGTEIIVEVEKIISAKTQARLDQGLQEVDLGVIDRADTIILYVKGVTPGFGRHKNGGNYEGWGWGYDWKNCDRDEKEYDYKLNFKVKVPVSVNLLVSTINEGEVKVSNTSASVNASNINGGITLTGISSGARANTINGDVDVTYVKNPSSDCKFYTLNGDINAYFKKGLSSRVSFKSFNGEFFTNVSQLEALPVEVEKSKTDKGMKYKINGNQYRTGNGGAHLDFETFNGDVYLREQ